MRTVTNRVGVVAVCYNSMPVLPDMLASVPEDVPVVLVDNSGHGDRNSLAALAAQYEAELISNDKNAGFGAACNQGAVTLATEFLLFLNPDAKLLPDTLERLLAAADTYTEAVAFNPRISSTQGRPLFKRKSHLLPQSERMPRGWPDCDREVTVLSGAAFFVRRAAFDAVGGFDPRIFLYHEDDDLSLRLRNKVGKLMFIRAAQVIHLEGRSSPRSAEIAALKAWHMGRSRVYATRKHGRPAPFVIALGSAIRQLASPLVLLSQRKRAKQLAYLRGVLSTYRNDGLAREDVR